MTNTLEERIEAAWIGDCGDFSCVDEALEKLDRGEVRIASRQAQGKWQVHEYLKKAILLYFKRAKAFLFTEITSNHFDKIPQKMYGWSAEDFEQAGFRAVPGSIVRYSAHVAREVVLMPSFVNVGAYIDEETMIDSHVLVGSCAQIGRRCHISDGTTIGGVLEPPQAAPVIVEDNCFVGAKCVLTEGILVEEGSVLASGTILSASTKIIDRETGVVCKHIPPYSVVVPGSYPSGGVNICCAVIVKQTDERTRSKTTINELLRL
jgi:2,3,4,5-tetrahydropyridine-2-carboxylate N-succinyltransferase